MIKLTRRGRLPFPSTLERILLAEARAANPQECCGLLLGHSGKIQIALPARNVHPTPQTHFEIDPRTLLDAQRAARADGPQVIGYYHSHPAGPPHPSASDREFAAGDGRIWAIIGQQYDIMFWRDGESGFEALSYESGHG